MRRKMSRTRSPFPIKGLLVVGVLVLVGIMIFNSNLLITMGIRKNPIPDSLEIDPTDPRIVAKFDETLDRNYIKESVDKFLSLLTGKPEQGKIVIVAMDNKKGFGIPNMTFAIENAITGALIEEVITNENGMAESIKLDYKTAYRVIPKDTTSLFLPYTEDIILEMNAQVVEVTLNHQMKDYVVDYRQNNDGGIEITSVYLPVPLIMQNPELPNGCEITAMASVLQHYGYEANHIYLSDHYLPKAPFYRISGDLYGPHPDVAFSGDPRDPNGWYVYAAPTAKAANDYIKDNGGSHRAVDITGSSRDEIMAHVLDGKPITIWATRDLSLGNYAYGWYVDGSDREYYNALINLHCMVIYGFDGDDLLVMDPLEGNMRYNKTTFFDAYDSLGSRAIIVEELAYGE